MKRTIHLNESELRRVINQCIYEAVQNGELDEGLWGKLKGGIQGLGSNLKNSYNQAMNSGAGIKGGVKNGWNNLKNMGNDIRSGAAEGDYNEEMGKINDLFSQLEDYIDYSDESVGKTIRGKAIALSRRKPLKRGAVNLSAAGRGRYDYSAGTGTQASNF